MTDAIGEGAVAFPKQLVLREWDLDLFTQPGRVKPMALFRAKIEPKELTSSPIARSPAKTIERNA